MHGVEAGVCLLLGRAYHDGRLEHLEADAREETFDGVERHEANDAREAGLLGRGERASLCTFVPVQAGRAPYHATRMRRGCD